MSPYKKNTFPVLLAYLAVAFSGIHFFQEPIPQLLFLFIIILFTSYNKFNNKKLFFIIIVFLYVVILQALIFESFSIYETSAFLIGSIVIPYIIFLALNIYFPKFYVKALYILSIICLIFYFISSISPEFIDLIKLIPLRFEFLDTSYRHNQFILYSVSKEYDPMTGLLRNYGAFHEPGVFSVFLVIGVYFNYIVSKKIFNKYGIVFIIAIISTFSTAGFLGLFLLVLGFTYSFKKYKFLRLPIVLIIGAIGIYLFFETDIMYEKIAFEYERDSEKEMDATTTGRIHGARKSIYVLSLYPLSGRGLTPSTRVTDENSPEFIRYGLLHEFAKVGFIVAILYLFFLIKGIRLYGKIYREPIVTQFFIVALIINLLSQSFAYSPVIMNFVFVGIFYNYRKPSYSASNSTVEDNK